MYNSAVKWLLEYARDKKKFDLVFKENVSYGFRRNMSGMRPIGIIVALAVVVFGVIGLAEYLHDLPSLLKEKGPHLGALTFSVLMLLWWIFGATTNWVRDAADAYARALLAVCEKNEPEVSTPE